MSEQLREIERKLGILATGLIAALILLCLLLALALSRPANAAEWYGVAWVISDPSSKPPYFSWSPATWTELRTKTEGECECYNPTRPCECIYHYEVTHEAEGYEVFACNYDGSVCRWVLDVAEPQTMIPLQRWISAWRAFGREPRMKVRAWRTRFDGTIEYGPYSELSDTGIGVR
jgi:hypothetical protein